MHVPTWSTAQSGPPPPMPQAQPAPPAPFSAPMPASPVAPPVAPPQHLSYPPGSWGPMPHHYQAAAQLYPIGYPLGPWSPYQQHYAGPHRHFEEDSKTAKPNKFTGWDPSKLHAFSLTQILYQIRVLHTEHYIS